MHRKLLKLLHDASGESTHVAVTFLDVRGFSTHAQTSESADLAAYLRSMYAAVLDDYFPDASFFKPTGDGLMIIHELPADEARLAALCAGLISKSLALVDHFHRITEDDLLINFDVPTRLGIGVARGSATRLYSRGTTIDYSGRCLNLAARLMDLARPSGVVFSDRFATQILELDAELPGKLEPNEVYIRGISEHQPLDVMVSGHVDLPARALHPLSSGVRVFSADGVTRSARDWRSLPSYLVPLDDEPVDVSRVGVHFEYELGTKDGELAGHRTTTEFPGTLVQEPEGRYVQIDLKPVKQSLRKHFVADDWDVRATAYFDT